MAFNNYLEDENDKPYFTTNSLAYYYDKMEGFAKAVEGSAKALNLTKEEIEQRIALRLAEWDKNLETFDSSVEKLLTEWVDDGTLTPLIDSTLIDEKITPIALQLAEKVGGGKKAELENLSSTVLSAIEGGEATSFNLLSIPQNGSVTPEKTNFLMTKGNLFNKKADRIDNGYYNNNGTWIANVKYYTIIMAANPNRSYANNLPKYYQCFFDSEMVRVGGNLNDAWTNINTPENTHFVAITLQYDTNTDGIMIVEGGSLPATYIPYGFTFNADVDTIKTTTGVVSVNKFNKDTIKIGNQLMDTGVLSPSANSSLSDKINVENETNVYISGLPVYTGYDRRYTFYNKDNAIVGGVKSLATSVTEKSIPVPSGASWFVFAPYQNKTSPTALPLDSIQVEMGTKKTPFVPYEEGIQKINGMKLMSPSTLGKTSLKTEGKNFLVFGDSITETATVSDDGATYTEGTRLNWTTFSKQSLKMGQLWNYAKGGARYKDNVAVEPRQQISHQITTAIANNRPADIIVVAAGINDEEWNIGDYETAMAKNSLESLDRKILYEAIRWTFWTLRKSYPEATCFTSVPIEKAEKEPMQNLNNAIIRMANRYNFIVIPAHTESGIVRDFEIMNAAGRDLYDGLHPNAKGSMKISRIVNKTILNHLNDGY